MVLPWADQPFPLIPTSKVTKPAASKDAIFVADGMANAHNMLLRGLNSIYLQAPYVKEKADIQDLLQYSQFWVLWINGHHDGEETIFFPELENITGEKGLMDRNIKQHHSFHLGMDIWTQYISDCLKKEEPREFDASKFTMLVDGFGLELATHLKEEIPTLLALDKYDITAVKEAWHKFEKHVRDEADPYTTLPLAMGNVDWTYEGGNNFPDMPFFLPYLVQYYFGKRHQPVWRFGPSSLLGKKRTLTFLPEN